MPDISLVHGIGTHSARPAAAATNNGWLYYETDTRTLFRSDGTAWTQVSAGAGVADLDDHVHVVGEKMTGDGATTVFYLANEAEGGSGQSSVEAFVAGSRTDVTLSADGGSVTFPTAPGAATAIRVNYLAVLGS